MAQIEQQDQRQRSPIAGGPPFVSPGLRPPLHAPQERDARRGLRTQITKLERELSDTLMTAFPQAQGASLAAAPLDSSSGGPRLLSLGDLERLRDRLAQRVSDSRAEVTACAEVHERNRILLERMLLEPGRYKFMRLPNADVGGGGCGVWQVRPRLGLIGMLAGWWHVKLSSGCPLAGGGGAAGRPPPPAPKRPRKPLLG